MTSNVPVERRSFMGAAIASVMAGIAGCNTAESAPQQSTDSDREAWPSPEDGQQEVMLLGTSHLAQTPEDTQNTFALDAGDVLGEQRQDELETLTNRLAEWEPDRIAVEYQSSDKSTLDQAYGIHRR